MKVAAIWALVLLAFLFFVPSSIKAQTHPCGAGPGPNEVQVGVEPGGNGVAPTPMCDWVNNNQPQPPPPQWQRKWGAFAFDSSNGKAGASVNELSQNVAARNAIAECQSNGGVACKVAIAYDNECIAVVAGDNTYTTNADQTIDKAIHKNINMCKATDTHCHVIYSACSLPVRIQ